jgi:hypothetical protein
LKKTHKNKKGKKIISNVFDLKKYGEKYGKMKCFKTSGAPHEIKMAGKGADNQ